MTGTVRLLDTEDFCCPQVQVKIRRFLSEELQAGVLCKIITQEPSTQRDMPLICAHLGYHLAVSSQLTDGRYNYTVAVSKDEAMALNNDVICVHQQTDEDALSIRLHDMFQAGVAELETLGRHGYLLAQSCSFGKDSSLTLAMGLQAHMNLMADPASDHDHDTPFIVIHCQTGIESVPMTFYAWYAMRKLRAFCQRQRINLELHYEKPPLHEQFASLFLGARKLFSTPALNSDCTVFFKTDVSKRIQRKLLNQYGQERLIAVTGSRLRESTRRRTSMKKYGHDTQTIEDLIKKNKKGINSYAVIRDWETHDVFDICKRLGSYPVETMPVGYRLPTFLPSYGVLIQIYGDSSGDVCEISLDEQSGCHGKSRNGCHQCFKIGDTDKSAVSHHNHVRWANISGNATKVRDWAYSIAHRLEHRTFHPRSHDPITNHVFLQPNIYNSRTLEKLLTYYVQLTHDDLLRADRFRSLVEQGREDEDKGVKEIMNDPAMDDTTREEFLKMYIYGAQYNVIETATLEHCIFLSAQWSMDGVKAVPFRPLYIWHQVTQCGKRLPWPKTDKSDYLYDKVPDAMAYAITRPGVDLMAQWVPPHRPWDVLDEDMNDGCFTEREGDTLKAQVSYHKTDKLENFTVKMGGKSVKLGPWAGEALKDAAQKRLDGSGGTSVVFGSKLRFRKMTAIGQSLSNEPRDARKLKIIQKTRRKTEYRKGKIVKTLTTLQTYNPKTTSSMTSANMNILETWVPALTERRVPFISSAQKEQAMLLPSFSIDTESLTDWLQFGGLSRCLETHDSFVRRYRKDKHKENGRYTLRRYADTTAFFTLFQSGLISVNDNSWHTCQATLKRTELFNEAGLFDFSDDEEDLRAHRAVMTMSEHRRIKATQLLKIRNARNKDRQDIRVLLAKREYSPGTYLKCVIYRLMSNLHELRMEYAAGKLLTAKMLSAMDIHGFDEAKFTRYANVCRDWMAEHELYFQSVDAISKRWLCTKDQNLLHSNVLLKIELNKALEKLNTEYKQAMNIQLEQWSVLLYGFEQSDKDLFAQRALMHMDTVDCQFSVSEIIGKIIADNLGCGQQEALLFYRPPTSEQVKIRVSNAKTVLEETQMLLDEVRIDNFFGKVTGNTRNAALKALYS